MKTEMLLPNESLIKTTDNDYLVLTTHRIRWQDGNELISIMLDKVSGIQVKFWSNIYLLILGIIASIGLVAFGFSVDSGDGTNLFIAAVVVLVITIVWFLSSRKHIVRISSSSTHIEFETKGMSSDVVKGFVNAVEGAIIAKK